MAVDSRPANGLWSALNVRRQLTGGLELTDP